MLDYNILGLFPSVWPTGINFSTYKKIVAKITGHAGVPSKSDVRLT